MLLTIEIAWPLISSRRLSSFQQSEAGRAIAETVSSFHVLLV